MHRPIINKLILPLFAAIFLAGMLYLFVKIWVRLSMPFYAKKVRLVNPELWDTPGPLLLACNHPNSFLDAIISGYRLKHPVHFMTRGDVFRKSWVRKIFSSLNMIPIFRLRDGKDKLSLNDETFTRSVEVLRNKQVLLIFVEGFCEHQTTLQLPLKKGAPRILQACWEEGIPVKVLPMWLQYNSFTRFGKTIDIRLGTLFGKEVVEGMSVPAGINKINSECTEQLLHLSNDIKFEEEKTPELVRWLLFIPAMLGAVLHAPLYFPLHALALKVSKDNVHFDAIMLALLMVCYPLYLIAITVVLLSLTYQWWPLLTLIVLPLLAKSYLHWKK